MSHDAKSWKKQDLVKIAKDSVSGMEEVLSETEKERNRYPFPLTLRQEAQLGRLSSEPVRARVVARNEVTGESLEIFICPAMPPTGAGRPSPLQLPSDPRELMGRRFASELSPMGRMASYPPGDVFTWKKAEFRVLESEVYDCKVTNGVPDSESTVVRHEDEDLPIVTLPPLQAFLRENSPAEAVTGIVRRQKQETVLRDPIVDREQADIAYQPIDSVIVMLGAPGTGKTTTLTKRLRLKTYGSGLEEEESEAVAAAEVAGMRDDWVLFTPTPLLRNYLVRSLEKLLPPEAASKITTWTDYRERLLRGSLSWIREAGGKCVRTDPFTTAARRSPLQVNEAFEAFELKTLSTDVRSLCAELHQAADKSLGRWADALSEKAGRRRILLSEVFCEILDAADFLSSCRRAIHEESAAVIQSFADAAEASQEHFRERWVSFLLTQHAGFREADTSDGAGQKSGEAELAAALAAYCRALAQSKAVPEGAASERVQFLQLVLPEAEKAKDAGRLLLQKAAIDQLLRLPETWLTRSVRRWKQFRQKEREAKKTKWFVKAKGSAAGLSPLEADHLILHHLKALQDFLSDRRLQARLGEKLKPGLNALCIKMVFVDEFTDFPPVQLAVMRRLAHPRLHSFFASGDFNQRLAPDGIHDEKELLAVLPQAEIKRLKTVYRQSRTLHDFAQKLLKAFDSRSTDDSSVSAEFASQPELEMKPRLAEKKSSLDTEAVWAAESLAELLARRKETVPSVAVFVPDQENVLPMAERLQASDIVKQRGLLVEGCPEGVLSRADVRIGVYPMDCVKGLEFEAALLTGIDRLARHEGRLFGTRLYVAATRAACFFGVSCSKLPSKLECLRDQFCEHWEELKPAAEPDETGNASRPENINLAGKTGRREEKHSDETPHVETRAKPNEYPAHKPKWLCPDGPAFPAPVGSVVHDQPHRGPDQTQSEEKSVETPLPPPPKNTHRKPSLGKLRSFLCLAALVILCPVTLYKCGAGDEKEELPEPPAPQAVPAPKTYYRNFTGHTGDDQIVTKEEFARGTREEEISRLNQAAEAHDAEDNDAESEAAPKRSDVLSLQMDLDNSTDAYDVVLEQAVPDWQQIRRSVTFNSWLRFGYVTDGDSAWAESTRKAVLHEAEEKRWSNVVISIYNDFKEQLSAYMAYLNTYRPGWQKDMASPDFWRWARKDPVRFRQIELWRDSLRADKMEEYLEQYRREPRRK